MNFENRKNRMAACPLELRVMLTYAHIEGIFMKPTTNEESFKICGMPLNEYKKMIEEHEQGNKDYMINHADEIRAFGLNFALQVTDEASLIFDDIGHSCIPTELRTDFLNTGRVLRTFRTKLIKFIAEN